MNFSEALEQIKKGKKVKRASWGGYWFLSQPIIMENLDVVDVDGKQALKCDNAYAMNKMIVAKLKDSDEYAPATPYQADLLANDWEIV